MTTTAGTQAFREETGDTVRRAVLGDFDDTSSLYAADRGSVSTWVRTYMFGEIWSRSQLSVRDRLFVAISGTAALGQLPALGEFSGAALDHGVTPEELDALLGQVLGYAGAPAALDAASVVGDVASRRGRSWPVGPPAAKTDAERLTDAYDVMRTLGGGRVPPSAEAGAAWFDQQFGDLGTRVYEWAFGEVWTHGPLSRRDRSLIVVSIIATQPAEPELRTHLKGALNHGMSREEIEEIFVTLSTTLGFPRSVGGLRIARELWETIDAAAAIAAE